MIRRVLPEGRSLRVCIVGAGVAGLRATDVLLQHGVDVTIYEGRNRVGGRLAQSNQLGHPVDLGPNWIHGTDNNPIMGLAAETNTKIHYWDERHAEFDDKGHRQPDADVTHRSELFWGIISDAFQYSKEHTATISANTSLMDFVKKEAASKFSDDLPEEAERKKLMLLQEAETWGAFVGSPIQQQSLKFFWLEECIEGENPFIAETYTKILKRIAQPAVEHATVELETKVTSVESGSEGVTVQTLKGGRKVFDEVIVTSPLGWLKRNHSLFTPPLPQRLAEAIDSIGYGSLDKVYITFPTAFWNTDDQPYSFPAPPSTSADDPAPNTTATTTPLHQDNTSPAPTNQYPGFTHFLSPTYARANWPQQALNLAALPPPCAHPTLLFYVFDECASYIASIAHSRSALLAFFKPYYTRLPGYDASLPSCVPTGALATAWAKDELAGYGSYSNFQTGLERGDEDIECMREGLPERRVWLAGEHTAPFKALGTVTGAYWAGEGVARRIAEVYGLRG